MAKKENQREYIDEYGKKKIAYRIKIFTAILMMTVAILADVLDGFLIGLFGAGLIVNTFEAFIEYGVFWIWFMLLGVPYTTDVWKFAVFIGSLVLEITPAVNAGPFFSVGMAIIIIITRHEDKSGKDYSLATLANPKNVVVRSSRITAQQAASLARKQLAGKVVRQKRPWASNIVGKGVDASGKEFHVKYSLDKKETLRGLSKQKAGMAKSYLTTKPAGNVLEQRIDDDDDFLLDDTKTQKARIREDNNKKAS